MGMAAVCWWMPMAPPPSTNRFYRQIAFLAYPLRHGPELAGTAGEASRRHLIFKFAMKSGAIETGFSMPDSIPLLQDVTSVQGEEYTAL
jgi:hypothetical protein